VLICHGGNVGGYTLFVKDNKLHYVHNYVGALEFHVASDVDVPEGKVQLRFEFEPTNEPDLAKGECCPGSAKLFIGGKQTGKTEILVTIPLALGIGSDLNVGRNPGSPVSTHYEPPFAFTGTIFKITADVSGKMTHDLQEEKKAMAKAAMPRH
jgi:arylsulfatase